MPNHCSHHFSFTADPHTIQKLYQHIVNPDGQPCVDFNRITPMPESLDIDNTSNGEKALALLQANPNQNVLNTNLLPHAHALVEVLPKYGYQWHSLSIGQLVAVLKQEPVLQQHYGYDFALAEQYLVNIQQHGFMSWYHWRLQHWGTKWNAYNGECEVSSDGCCLSGYFETAWSPAEPVYRKLASLYPSVEIKIEYMDEFAEFAGVYQLDGHGGLVDYEMSREEIDVMFEENE